MTIQEAKKIMPKFGDIERYQLTTLTSGGPQAVEVFYRMYDPRRKLVEVSIYSSPVIFFQRLPQPCEVFFSSFFHLFL